MPECRCDLGPSWWLPDKTWRCVNEAEIPDSMMELRIAIAFLNDEQLTMLALQF